MDLKFKASSGIYGRCEKNQNAATSKRKCEVKIVRIKKRRVKQTVCSLSMDSGKRPCLSERYVNTVKNSFDLVSSCLKDYLAPQSKFSQIANSDLKSIQDRNILSVFSLLTQESGLHFNAMSPSGAGGLGQLTEDGLNAVEKSQISDIKAFLTRPESSILCKNLSRVYLNPGILPRTDYDYNCDRISVTRGQPVVGLIYVYGHIKLSEDEVNRFLNKNDGKYRQRFNLSEVEMDRLVTALSLWSHNTGAMGLLTPMTYLIRNKYSKKKVTNVDLFIDELKKYMGTHSISRSRRRVLETQGYYSEILKIQNRSGAKCLAQ